MPCDQEGGKSSYVSSVLIGLLDARGMIEKFVDGVKTVGILCGTILQDFMK